MQIASLHPSAHNPPLFSVLLMKTSESLTVDTSSRMFLPVSKTVSYPSSHLLCSLHGGLHAVLQTYQVHFCSGNLYLLFLLLGFCTCQLFGENTPKTFCGMVAPSLHLVSLVSPPKVAGSYSAVLLMARIVLGI